MKKFKFLNKNKILNLPQTPGVYCFTEKKEVIYIGKAINIRDRVKNHFNQRSYRDELFMDRVDKVGYFKTGSEIEALILEANLIKKYQPKFNVVWRDDKNYFFVAITRDEQPIVYITHQKNEEDDYIGPFVEGTALKKTLRFLRRAFPYYTAKKHPKIKCTYCHLGLCPGPLLFENPSTPFGSAQDRSSGLREYRRNIKKLILILQGKRSTVLNSLKKEMKQLSKEKMFEEAKEIRDRIYNLQQVMSHTSVIENNWPDSNARDDWQKTQKILQGLTSSKKEISKIECYDVSNIQGKSATGSMIVFVNGKADKKQYRKFHIRIGDKPNDIAMLKETIERRLLHKEWPYPKIMLVDGGVAQLNIAIKTRDQFAKNIYPVKSTDGVGGISPKAEQFNRVKILSLAKKNKELYIEGKNQPILLKALPKEIHNLILQLDNEAHRFAVAYHKKLRKNSLLQKA